MPTIYDNIDEHLLPNLCATYGSAARADFCVGYFNLRGWRLIEDALGENGCEMAPCRLLIGMIRRPEDELKRAFGFGGEQRLTQGMIPDLRRELAQELRTQLTVGAPTQADIEGLRALAGRLRSGTVKCKLHLKHPLHAKLYLIHRDDADVPLKGYLGSSNLTMSGLQLQGELNIDVLEQDAAGKLARWFEDRWTHKWSVDITEELIQILEESWASQALTPPYHVYLKMAYELSQEARAGLTEFSIPHDLESVLFDFQARAVQIAARYVNQQGGVLIGDVVGLGKTLMATAIARLFQDDLSYRVLILCPKNLESMWGDYLTMYDLTADVLPVSQVMNKLPDLRRYNLVIIDESQNLRNREGKRYQVIRDYMMRNESRCILLSATPYNKSYQDISNQLRLFLPDDHDLGIRPERLLRETGLVEFNAKHQCSPSSLDAFDHSEFPEDWRELMRLFMVRRTRSFIREHYARRDEQTGRAYLLFENGDRAYFPDRIPSRAEFDVDERDPQDQYARLYAPDVVDTINSLTLPRYGLANYALSHPKTKPTAEEQKILADLTRGGRRLMGFCRTNLFKRLESSGYAFFLSIERHALRNYVLLHALETGQPLPIGTQSGDLLDTAYEDVDPEGLGYSSDELMDDDSGETPAFDPQLESDIPDTPLDFERRGERVYRLFREQWTKRFRWLPAHLFSKALAKDLRRDAEALIQMLARFGQWRPENDHKLDKLQELIQETHADEKVLVFSQFADTVGYLAGTLQARGVQAMEGVTGDSADPTWAAWRFSPVSNRKREKVAPEEELRVLIATDVLSEGQNLQDAHIVINYDLPWAIIKLIQRVGRVDRIGQQADTISSYCFWPADGLETMIRLRERLQNRLQQNAEVVGSDERFFEDDHAQRVRNLYNETSGVLDEEDGGEIDLVSHAHQIWQTASDADPSLRTTVPKLPSGAFASKAVGDEAGEGSLALIRSPRGQRVMMLMDAQGEIASTSQFELLSQAQCAADTPALETAADHHERVRKAGEQVAATGAPTIGGQVGGPRGARFRAYTRLKQLWEKEQAGVFRDTERTHDLAQAVALMHQAPLREAARAKISRQIRTRIDDDALANLVIALYHDDMLCVAQPESDPSATQVICSMGLIADDQEAN